MGIPKLQFAIDTTNIDQAYKMADEAVLGGVDIIEVGTPVITRHGLDVVRHVCERYCPVPVYADIKTIDFPKVEVKECLQTGASLFLVMLFSHNDNVQKSLELAASYHATAVFSTMCYPLSLMRERISSILDLGGLFFIAHGSGVALELAYADMKERAEILSEFHNIKLILAGGITESNVKGILKYAPEIVIIGRGISQRNDIKSSIRRMKSILSNEVGHDRNFKEFC